MPKPLNILYDPQMFDLQNYGGISRYFTNLIQGINKRPDFNARLPLAYSKNYYVRHFPQPLNNVIGRSWLGNVEKRIRTNQAYAKLQIRKSNFDVFHASYYNPYFLEDLKKPFVVTVHDMIYENYPHLFADAKEVIQQKKKVIETADLIIAISNYTKQQILKYYPNISDKIHVIYHGLPDEQQSASNETLPKKFLLYIGDRTAFYKNFRPLMQAIAPVLSEDPDLYMICAGGGNFNQDELTLFQQLNTLNSTIQIDATDALITQLYKEAIIFIYPSLEEGFGLPMLEAFKNGCAIACSNTSCLPEVGGQAVAYFDPKDLQSIQNTVSKLISSTQLTNDYINLGYQQLEKFTFENCLNQTLDCYRSIVTKARK